MKLRLAMQFNVGMSQKYPFRVFLSIAPTATGFVGLIREHDPVDGKSRTDLRVLTFNCGGYLENDELLVEGEDPRLFTWKGKLYALTWIASPHGDWYHWLVDVQAKTRVQLKIEPWIYHGKNWVPFIYDHRLFIIRSLDPLIVMEADHNTGICSVINVSGANSPIGEYRGGSCASSNDGRIVGFGHRTINASCHTVFRYVIDTQKWDIQKEHVDVLGVDGMGIVDPTSSWDGFVACCASAHGWHCWQPMVHGLFEII